jgi:hypothetical protein
MFSKRWEKGAGQSNQRVLGWYGGGSEYLKGVAKVMEMVMCDGLGLSNKKGFPLPREFY